MFKRSMKKNNIISLLMLGFGLFGVTSVGLAQEEEGQGKSQTLNFEDELVEGGTQKPELFYLLQKKKFNYNKLIRLREHFIPEMRETAEIVKKSGSKR